MVIHKVKPNSFALFIVVEGLVKSEDFSLYSVHVHTDAVIRKNELIHAVYNRSFDANYRSFIWFRVSYRVGN